ncbi:MAG: ABC-type phospholipid uptake system permease component MlaE [Oceanicaulis sp. HLUCCA04]|nr:MAG: ABC-type phospholipid uptake system permease component MlaE [Oceanicaulis sp. HLUCCA04]
MAAKGPDQREQPRLAIRETDGGAVLEAAGDWLIGTIGPLDRQVRAISDNHAPENLRLDTSGIGRIDTAGAYLLGRPLRKGDEAILEARISGDHKFAARLIREVHARIDHCPPEESSGWGLKKMLVRIGAGTQHVLEEAWDTLGFFGHTLMTLVACLINPARLRWTPTVHLMETVGINALPIIAALSFFIGAVVAFMGASLLETFGASVFTVDLVGISVLREFGVLITAIMLAGRSDSAFTASIGSMKMQQEVDAMKVIGLDPFEVLVVPRVIACVVMAPLLALAAMLAGLFGGLLVSWATLDISPTYFLTRLQNVIDWSHFMVGMSKAPVFGLVIAVIGCRQGMMVGGDVESLGQRTTASVVQAIFMVIVIDALFALMYLEADI